MTNKIYTAQELREAALSCETVEVADQFYSAEMDRAATMLCYAADVVERCEKLKLNMIPHRHDKEIVDYIIRGDAGKEEK